MALRWQARLSIAAILFMCTEGNYEIALDSKVENTHPELLARELIGRSNGRVEVIRLKT